MKAWIRSGCVLLLLSGCAQDPGRDTTQTNGPVSSAPPAPAAPGSTTAGPEPSRAGPTVSAPKEPVQIRPGQWLGPIQADDPQHVDVADLLSQALALAVRIHPEPKLVHIYASEVVEGTVDVAKPAAATYKFEYEGFDRTKPPGKDEVRLAIEVSAGNGQLWAFSHGGAHRLRVLLGGQALPAPCPTRKAWAAAVKSGVPDNAVATFDYQKFTDWDAPLRPGGRTKRNEWKVHVRGHADLTRHVDARSCAVFEEPRASSPPASSGAADPWSKVPFPFKKPKASP